MTAERMVTVGRTIAVLLAALLLALVAACAAPARHVATKPVRPEVPTRPMASAARDAVALGVAGTYEVGGRQLTFEEPAQAGQRTLITRLWYPLAGHGPASGPLPLILFAPGFMLCDGTYTHLLKTWASAGYVVAAVNFPRTDCRVGAAANERDLVNQPGDLSYVLSSLLTLSARPGGPLSGLLNRDQVAAAGHSDGGDTVAALAANTCCADHRLKAAAVLSGAEWPPMPGRYFTDGAPPMLFVQGSADTINPPWASLQLYRADHAGDRYYLDLLGVTHMTPYAGTNPVQRRVARVTLAFFDRYLLGQAGAADTMTREGNSGGNAVLVSGGQPPP